jgi:hypothetical protein
VRTRLKPLKMSWKELPRDVHDGFATCPRAFTTHIFDKMRIQPRLLMASPTSVGPTKGFRPAPMALLPPIPLYRRLFRAHRKYLPREMRLVGDEYIKSEFRAHRDVENPVHIVRPLGSQTGGLS